MLIPILFHIVSYISIASCTYSVLSKKPGFSYFSALLATPLCLYTAAVPAFSYWPLLLPPMILLSGLSMKLGSPTIALLLSLPYLGFSVFAMTSIALIIQNQ